MTITQTTPGKINLFLDVLGKRPDGYHELRTVFLPVGTPCDTITVRQLDAPGLAVTCSRPEVPDGEANLCWRAAQAFAEASGISPAWEIGIDKQIPVAAGMGGGSADAAAVLLALNQLHEQALDAAGLHATAAGLGADIPFFVDPQPALGEGIGERLRPVPLACDLPLVLVNPGFPVPVSWSYANLGRVLRPAPPSCPDLLQAMAAGDLDGIARGTYNALEYAVRDKFPLLDMLREAMLAAGCLAVAVSGSGPTLFGIAGTDAESTAASLGEQFGESFWICPTRVTATT